MAETTLTMRMAPVLAFRVVSVGGGYVELEVFPMVTEDPSKVIRLRAGDVWTYDLTLNSNGWHQDNHVESAQPALPRKRRRVRFLGKP